MGDVNKPFVSKTLLTTPRNVLPLHLKQTFPFTIWIFTEGEEIESRLPFTNFSTLINFKNKRYNYLTVLLRGWLRWYTSAKALLNGVGVRGASESLALRIGLVLPDSSRELFGVCNEELRLLGATGVDCAVGNELEGDNNPKLMSD